jgi:rod shape-determining protein MreC
VKKNKANKINVFLIIIVIFALLVFISSIFLLRNSNPFKNKFISIYTTIAKPFISIRDKFTKENSNQDNEKFSYKELYYKLLAEYNILEAKYNSEKLTKDEYNELKKISKSLANNNLGKKKIISANISFFVEDEIMDSFYIDKGKKDNLTIGQPVIYDDCLIGIIVEVSDNNARVLAISSSYQKLSFVPDDDYTKIGILNGKSEGILEGYFLDENIKVYEGEKIYTSGLTKLIPRGIEIGTIIKREANKENMLTKILIEMSQNIKRIKKVGVVV